MFDGDGTSNFPTEPPVDPVDPDDAVALDDVVAPEDLVDELESIFVRRDRDEARIAVHLARAGETRAFERDGYSSLTALLKHRMRLHPGEAMRLVRRANALPEMPLTSLAYERGAISGAQVDVLLEVRAVAPEPFTASEGSLVELAMDTPMVKELRKQLDYWLDQVAHDDLASDRNLVRELRSLRLRRDGEVIRVSGWMDLESGERLAARLEPGPPAAEDTRTAPARRADLLLELIDDASEKPGIIVHVSAATLLQGSPGISETSTGTFLTSDEIRRITCEANLTRVIFGPDSQPIEVGRTKRLVTPAQRLAVMARDRVCVWPNCDRGERWCDVHHLIHWADGGETEIDNLVLLCRHHHTLIHQCGWQIIGTPGQLRFLRPDRTELGTHSPFRESFRSPVFAVDTAMPDDFDFRDVQTRVRAIGFPRGP